jgi:ribosomal protein S1/DNA-binding XRE family transcriptional regulator
VGGTVFSWQPRIGLFVTLEGSRVNGLVPRSTLEDDAHFEVGTGVLVEVRGVDRDAREVELAFLGTRPESPEALIGHRPGERLVGTVTHVEPARGYALVALPDGFTAILPAPRLSPAGRSALLSGKVRVGDRVPVVVAEVDARRRRIELTDPVPERRAIRHPTFAAGEHDVRVEVGRRLRALRTQAGMTQVQLATRAAVHPTQVAHVEGGRTNPSLWTIVRLARALDLDPSELIGGLVPADDEVSP